MQNKFLTLVLAGVLASGLTCGAVAQETPVNPQQQSLKHGHRPKNPKHQLMHLTRLLNLTADQQNQIKPILEGQDQKLQQLAQNRSLSRKEQHSQKKTITEDANSKINAILNDQQKQQFAQMQQQKHSKNKKDQ